MIKLDTPLLKPPRLVFLILNGGIAGFNAAMALFNAFGGRWGLFALNLVCVAVGAFFFGWLFRLRYLRKEETSSSQNQQPTSGTSQNPSPSLSLDLNVKSLTVSGNFLSQYGAKPDPNQSPPQLQPEPRRMPVVGFRSWNVESSHRIGIGPSWRLQSYNVRYGGWEPGVNDAVCRIDHYLGFYGRASIPDFHAAPNPNCRCGFYVLTDFDKVPFATERITTDVQTGQEIKREPITMIVGAVVGWGKVVQHDDEGWRAEKVQIIALLDCKVSDDHLRITYQIAERYGVPVLERKALELLAREYGDPLGIIKSHSLESGE